MAALCALLAVFVFALAAGIPAGADETPGTTPVPWMPSAVIERSPVAAPTETPADAGGRNSPPPIPTHTPIPADTPVPTATGARTTDHTATTVPTGAVGDAHPVPPIVPPADAGATAAPTTQIAGSALAATPIPTRTRTITPTPTAPRNRGRWSSSSTCPTSTR